MKNIIILLIVVVSKNLQAQKLPVRFSELSIHKERAYYQGQPFTGIAFELAANRTKILDANYQNGYLNGPYTEWYDNGKKKKELFYINGKLDDGKYFTYEPNGNKSVGTTYKNGIAIEVETYKEQQLDGMKIKYYPSGNVQSQTTYKAGKKNGIEKHYSESSKLIKEITFLNDQLNGLLSEYNNDGFLISQTLYDKGIAKSVVNFSYYPSGQLKSKETLNGQRQRNGIYQEYFENGDKKKQSLYENGFESKIEFENKNNPALAIKEVNKKEPDSYFGVAHKTLLTNSNIDHLNIQFKYNLANSPYKQELEIYNTQELYKYRLRQLDVNSSEQLHLSITLQNFNVITEYIPVQTIPFTNLTTPAGYKAIATMEIDARYFVDLAQKLPLKVSFTTGKFANQQLAINEAVQKIGLAVVDKLYQLMPISALLTETIETKKSGEIKKVKIDAGTEEGIVKGMLVNVYDTDDNTKIGGSVIGKLKATDEIYSNSAICIIKEGEERIRPLLAEGKKLKLIASDF